MRVSVLGAQNSFWRSNKYLFRVAWSRIYIFEQTPKSIQDVIGDVFCPGRYCCNREKCESLDDYVTTPRSIYGCGKCGAWLFVSNNPFMLQVHVKTTKTDKTRFFFARKKMNSVPNKQVLPNVPFQSTKKKKNCVWTTKYKKQLEICFVQDVEMKSVFTFQPIKRLVFTTVKSAKPAATFWIFHSRTKNLQSCYLVHNILHEKRVATTKKNHLHICKFLSANQIQAHPNLNQKKQKLFHLWYNRVGTGLIDTVNQNFICILILYNFSLH